MIALTVSLVCIIVILILSAYCHIRRSIGINKCSRHMVGKVVIVTGGTNGIGYETAKDLAERGARVIMTTTQEERGKGAKERIIATSNNTDVHLYEMDFNSIKSVREFAQIILEKEEKIDVLINNAGILISENKKTFDGLLQGMQVNYFGPFLLTQLLLPLIKNAAPSRIITVSTIICKYGSVDSENLNLDGITFTSFNVYKCSKLCGVLSMMDLSRQLQGTGVTVNCLHPGSVHTNIIRKHTNEILFKVMEWLGKPFVKTAWEGAQTTLYLAVAPELSTVSGCYFSDCKKIDVPKKFNDLNLARQVFDSTKKLLNLN